MEESKTVTIDYSSDPNKASTYTLNGMTRILPEKIFMYSLKNGKPKMPRKKKKAWKKKFDGVKIILPKVSKQMKNAIGSKYSFRYQIE